MPLKPEANKIYQRERARLIRAGLPTKGVLTTKTNLTDEELQTAAGMLKLLSKVISGVQAADGDTFMKARLTGYLISIGLKCVETADLEQRLTLLEATLLEKKE